MGAYRINIIGLSNKVHQFDYELDASFFREYGTDLLPSGNFKVNISLDKRETFLEANLRIQGTAHLVCDRSLEPFDYPIDTRRKVVFKYGEQDEEITDEIMIIQRDTAWIEMGQYMYEFIALSVPLKKIHPRFRDDDEGSDGNREGRIVYTSGAAGDDGPDDNNDETDPRWNALKDLK